MSSEQQPHDPRPQEGGSSEEGGTPQEDRHQQEEDERRSLAYRKLEDENSDLRRKVAGLEIEVMRLTAQLDIHGGHAPTVVTP